MSDLERVLVVEDDPLVAEAAIAALSTLPDLEVVHVDDGRRALVRLTTDTWHLIVSDIELPNADGLQILEAAKDADASVPVILMTAHEKLDYAIAAVRGSADEFLVKPIDPHALAARAKALLGAARVRRAGEATPHRAVLAIGESPEDVELGCGGTLLEHRALGDEVTVLCLSGGETIAAIDEQIETLRPGIVYTHSLNDNHQDHRDVHRATIVAAREVLNVFAYQSPSTGIAFSPGRFVDITPYMDAKLRALRELGTQHAIRPYLEEELVVATARYWSRFGVGRYVEPMEVVRTSVASVRSAEDPAARAAGR